MNSNSHLSRLGLATVLLGAFLSIADFFIVNVALPTIDADLRPSPATLQLVVAGYGVPYALLLVLGGRLGDLFGRRRLFMLGMASFTVFSLLCGLAPTAGALVAFRALQGASAAFMVPQVLATIQAARVGQARVKAIGLYGATAGVAAAVGQLAGGALISADLAGTEWRLIFLVNVPIGIVGLFLAWRAVPVTHSNEPHRIDVPGTLLLAATLLALLVPLTEGRTLGWPAWSIAMLAAVVPLGAAFALVERRLERTGHHPIVPPSMLRLPGMHRGLLIAVPFFTGFSAFMFVSALTFQQGAHLSPFQSGLALLPMAVSFLLASLLTARMVARFGPTVLTVGALIQAVGLTGLAFTLWQTWPTVDPVSMAPAMIVAGIGQAFVLSPLFGFILAGVPAERAGVGSGILTTTQQSALALGVATLGSMFLSLSAPDSIGFRDAFVAVLAAQVAIALVVAIASRTMPRPERAKAPVIRVEPVTAGD
jgi:EmrB/QacA subfamily drug resistance transporter